MRKNFRNRNKKKSISTKYMLLIMSGICVVSILICFTFNISGGPLNSFAGYIFVPMQTGINNSGNWILDKANDFKTLGEVLEENKLWTYSGTDIEEIENTEEGIFEEEDTTIDFKSGDKFYIDNETRYVERINY